MENYTLNLDLLHYLNADIEYVLAELEHTERFYTTAGLHKSRRICRSRRRRSYLIKVKEAWLQFHYSNRKLGDEKLLQSALRFYQAHQLKKIEHLGRNSVTKDGLYKIYQEALETVLIYYETDSQQWQIAFEVPLFTLVLLAIWARWDHFSRNYDTTPGPQLIAVDDLQAILLANEHYSEGATYSPELKAKIRNLCDALNRVLLITPRTWDKWMLKFAITILHNYL